MSGMVRLGNLIEKAHVKCRDFGGEKELEAFGVSNTDGITRTAHRKSDDLGEYLVIEPGYFAYNPYRVNVGSIGLTPANVTGLVSPAYIVFRVKKQELVPEVLLDFLKSSEGLRQINKLARGTVRKALRYEDLCQIEFPAISHGRQLQILQHKQGFNKQHGSLLSEITHQESLLAKLQQAILQDAIQGKLTTDWRAAHPKTEPASELLLRIQAEKARLIATKQLRPEKPLPKVNPAETPFELPKSWEWTRLGSVARHSLGKMLDKGKNRGQQMPYLRNLNVRWYEVDTSDLKTMPFEEHELEKYSVRRGDILICEGGHGIGRAAVWKSDKRVMFQKALHRVRPIGHSFQPELFVHFLKWSDTTRHITQYYTGAGIPHLTGDSIHEMPIPLPPIPEQEAILARVEALMTTCRALQKEIQRTRTHADHLLQAVLKEAFAPAAQPAPSPPTRIKDSKPEPLPA